MKGENNIHCYEDIINLQHPTSSKHRRMSRLDRAAQFAPFAALTGHDAAIRETARLTDEKIELDEDAKAILNEKLLIIRDNICEDVSIKITYFVPDEKKSGGMYLEFTGYVKRFDSYRNELIMQDGTEIQICNICGIECELFDEM